MVMALETTTLVKNSLGLYDLTIKAADGSQIMALDNITFERAVAAINARDKKQKGEKT